MADAKRLEFTKMSFAMNAEAKVNLLSSTVLWGYNPGFALKPIKMALPYQPTQEHKQFSFEPAFNTAICLRESNKVLLFLEKPLFDVG